MSISIHPITSPSDFDTISPMVLSGWQAPYNPQLKHFRPISPTPAAAIEWDKQRSLRNLRDRDPKLFMLKAVDDATGAIVGFAQWYVNDKPDPYGERTVATWHPEGSDEREFAERFINGLWGFIGKKVKGKHMGWFSTSCERGKMADVDRSAFYRGGYRV